MTISAASAAVAAAVSAPDDVTVTTALTSLPPMGRYSFWYASAVKRAHLRSPLLWLDVHNHDGDVVVAAGCQRGVGE